MFNDRDGLENVYFLASEGTAEILMRQEKHTKASSTATMKWDVFFFLTFFSLKRIFYFLDTEFGCCLIVLLSKYTCSL